MYFQCQRKLRISWELRWSHELVDDVALKFFFHLSYSMDLFIKDSYNLPYNTNAYFSQAEHYFLNHAQAPDVSVNMLCIQFVPF